jgi:hypothetical protein
MICALRGTEAVTAWPLCGFGRALKVLDIAQTLIFIPCVNQVKLRGGLCDARENHAGNNKCSGCNYAVGGTVTHCAHTQTMTFISERWNSSGVEGMEVGRIRSSLFSEEM